MLVLVLVLLGRLFFVFVAGKTAGSSRIKLASIGEGLVLGLVFVLLVVVLVLGGVVLVLLVVVVVLALGLVLAVLVLVLVVGLMGVTNGSGSTFFWALTVRFCALDMTLLSDSDTLYLYY